MEDVHFKLVIEEIKKSVKKELKIQILEEAISQ